MATRSKLTKTIITIIILIALALTAWWFLKPKEKAPEYITSEVTIGDIEQTVLATGVLEATKMVSVGSQVSGQVKKMYVQLGDQVKQGQLIAQIDSVRQENDLKTAEASIQNQQAQLAVKQANLAKVEAEYNRQKAMYAQDATSRSELEAALASYKIAQAEIVALNAQIEQSRLTLATAKENVGYTRIVAPMDGTVVAIVTEEGQTVNANQSAPTIVKLARLDNMTIKAQISEADVMKVEKGQVVYFTTLGNSEKKHYATLRQVEPAPNSINTESNNSSSSTSTAVYYNALFDVPNEDGKLRIDMTAQVTIVLDQAKQALTIPAAALQTSNRPNRSRTDANGGRGDQTGGKPADVARGEGRAANDQAKGDRPPCLELTGEERALVEQGKATRAMVRVLQADGTAKPQPVLVGLNNRVSAQILKGLKEGDKVVIADGSDTSNDSSKRGGPGGSRGAGPNENVIMNQQQPLLEVKELTREFPAGESTVQILKGINLAIYPGELVAIIGQSGSGKSTLMNILGCLDKPTKGSYRVNGQETRQLEPDQLAKLRREYFGFIFQRYHLLGDLSATGNVEIPAVYAGADVEERQARAKKLLTDLGLGEKTENRPSQLSGGQQQRVSIARALMNGGEVILADEPTGALDKHSGIEVMRILRELNAQGHTVILVTHDINVAKNATRIIEISDGQIISDTPNTPEHADQDTPVETPNLTQEKPKKKIPAWRSFLDRLGEAFRMALISMNAHRMRTFLTMLGIIIGIASVVSVVALGNGSQKQILENISSLGTNTITIFQGRGFGDNSRASQVKTLIPADADALAEQPYVDGVSPSVNTNVTGRFKDTEASITVNGVSEDFFYVKGMTFKSGQSFEKSSIVERTQDVVIDTNTQKTFFSDVNEPVGQVLLLGSVPSRVIGVVDVQQGMMGGSDSLNVYLPYSTVMSRMLGQSNVRSIIVRIKDEYSSSVAENAILSLLEQRHGAQDVFSQNADSIRQTIQETTATMTLLISAIAVISLVVGGIGVMNIMLVSVTERTQEIGVRMAVGARQSDILQQFLIEAVLVCILGGILGVLLALGIGQIITKISGGSFQMAYSTTSMIAAFVCSSLIGILFGYLPAKNAAQLDPVAALSRE